MNYTTSQNLNFTHESDQSSFRKTNGKVKNFGKINHIDFKPSINEKDFFSESNCGLSRSESPNELKKNNVYKKAEVFKNVTLADPKFKRMTESLTKVFGLSDPPPGFGFCYPRYYYLEQKRPQPMNPLKSSLNKADLARL
ncbi:hypothetical protein BpHYR1_029564 [Brachionus plicatilis]|uniref:Uncharacterized protein n=1 Tax=Brachionus plicatilis TaxID=10195 RepID=A0A3M7P9N9_BRAPC|nr:hypothetical protein BpHYR1_029564 [Brachionus plicatilis]